MPDHPASECASEPASQPPAPQPDLSAIQAELEAAETQAAEAASVHGRLESVAGLIATTAALLLTAREKLQAEQRDVAALESFSPTRIWAALRGTHTEDLDREKAEVQAAQYEVATLEAKLAALRSDEDSLRRRAAQLAGAADRRQAALAAQESALIAAGGEVGAELAALAAELAATSAELIEVSEAFDAATAAAAILRDADTLLGKASGWADVDTWLGGGLITDMIKYDRMDEATATLRNADAALTRLSRELGDLGREGVSGPEVTDLTRAFDVWFDNIFSDWAVKRRIYDAQDRTRRAFHAVADVRRSLFARRSELTDAVAALRDRRDDTLHAAR